MGLLVNNYRIATGPTSSQGQRKIAVGHKITTAFRRSDNTDFVDARTRCHTQRGHPCGCLGFGVGGDKVSVRNVPAEYQGLFAQSRSVRVEFKFDNIVDPPKLG